MSLQKAFFAEMGTGQQLRHLFDHIPGLFFFVKDRKSRLIFASKDLAVRLGVAAESDLVGRTDYDFFPSQIADSFVRDDQQVIRTGQPLVGRVEIWYTAQHLLDWFITTKLPIFNVVGQAIGIMGIVQSYAERKGAWMADSQLARVLAHIREHHRRAIPLSELVRVAGLSERQLLRRFRREFGMTVQEFLIKTRIQAAADALVQQASPLSEIAAEFGFYDQSSFTRIFKQYTGLTPGKFRGQYARAKEAVPGSEVLNPKSAKGR